MTIADTLLAAERAVREYAVYLSEDADRARARQDRDAVDYLNRQWAQAHALGDELRALNPDTVEAEPATVHQLRVMVSQLAFRLEQIVPGSRRGSVTPVASPATLRLVPAERIVAYLRVSTDRQADRGFGLEVQEASIRKWARERKMRIGYVVRDEGKSGAADLIDRPGLAEALGHVAAGRAQAIVVARLDRVARDLVLQEWVRAELLKMGGALRSADATEDVYLVEDPDNPTGTLVRQILGAVAQYERAMIRLRMNAGKARKKQAGGYTSGQPPYGHRAAGGELVPDVDEQTQIRRMKRWRREGKSLRDIAERLNAEGVPARRGRWHPQTVQRVVDVSRRRDAS